MEIQENIVNKVAQSGLVTVDLATYAPTTEIVEYDIKDNLFHGLILKEKDFRDFVKNHDFSIYQDKVVAITCSTDAIVPTWAYMILSNRMSPYAQHITFGTKDDVYRDLFLQRLQNLDYQEFQDQRVVIKGCGDIPVPESVFIQFTSRLTPIVRSIMYGEPCSTVPIYKRKS